jgi:hypothetical protein
MKQKKIEKSLYNIIDALGFEPVNLTENIIEVSCCMSCPFWISNALPPVDCSLANFIGDKGGECPLEKRKRVVVEFVSNK